MSHRFSVVLLAMTLVLGGLAVPRAHAANKTTTTTLSLPFSGFFYDSITTEWVDVSGSVNITTHVTFGSTNWTLDFYSALPANITAVGRTSGLRYLANGAALQSIQLPPNPIRPVFAHSVFKIFVPTDPYSPTPGRPEQFLWSR